MKPIPMPESNLHDPDEVQAQVVAAHSSWQWDEAGMIFDEHDVFVARSLTSLGAVMRTLGWFVPEGNRATGVNWHEVPDDESTRAEKVRAATPRN